MAGTPKPPAGDWIPPEYTFVSLYSLMLTALPVFVLGATDQDLISSYILRYLGVYKLGIQQNCRSVITRHESSSTCLTVAGSPLARFWDRIEGGMEESLIRETCELEEKMGQTTVNAFKTSDLEMP
ncbi:hypothetical protein BGZ95_009739 [Linnemannia exigua]|uniref:Uncharacterized protein n=1 Tax=Linnemannia exigua TaxID=604196 RepID=A0AAD4DCH3_9FUNG|nr:hypothetical protein BGZ95_009739 [Linnemannia exigua]